MKNSLSGCMLFFFFFFWISNIKILLITSVCYSYKGNKVEMNVKWKWESQWQITW